MHSYNNQVYFNSAAPAAVVSCMPHPAPRVVPTTQPSVFVSTPRMEMPVVPQLTVAQDVSPRFARLPTADLGGASICAKKEAESSIRECHASQRVVESIQKKYDASVANHVTDVQEKNQIVDRLRRQSQTLQRQLQSLQAQLSHRQEQIKSLGGCSEDVSTPANHSAEASRRGVQEHLRQQALLKSQISNIKSKLSLFDAEVADLLAQVEPRRAVLSSIQSDVSDARDALRNADLKCRSEKRDSAKLHASVSSMRKQLSDGESLNMKDIEKLERQIASLKDQVKSSVKAEKLNEQRRASIASKMESLTLPEDAERKISSLTFKVNKLQGELKSFDILLRRAGSQKQLIKNHTNAQSKHAEVAAKEKKAMDSCLAKLSAARSERDAALKKIDMATSDFERQLSAQQELVEHAEMVHNELCAAHEDVQAQLGERLEQLPENTRVGPYTMGYVREVVDNLQGLHSQVGDLERLVEVFQHVVRA